MESSNKNVLILRPMMNPDTSITIAIPTYNRAKTVLKTLASLSPIFEKSNTQILVIDNGSTDETSLLIKEAFSQVNNLSIIRYEHNFGFLESFLRLFDNCTTEYLFVLSDEDQVSLGAFPGLLHYITRKQPGFLSTDFYNTFGLYRGSKISRPITYLEIEKSAFYISGLVFRTDISQNLISEIRNNLTENSFVLLYPQTYLALRLKMISKAYWYGDVLSFERDELTSFVVNEFGESYSTVKARIGQHYGWKDMIFFITSFLPHQLSRRDLFEIRGYSNLRWRHLNRTPNSSEDKVFPKVRDIYNSTLVLLWTLKLFRKLFWFSVKKFQHLKFR
jgi:glycosyltransferase involved in cell wall biosynthesis